jgi:hypothetical protein
VHEPLINRHNILTNFLDLIGNLDYDMMSHSCSRFICRQDFMNEKTDPSDSERYRQMLVRDGDRRFKEWHVSFLNAQKQCLNRDNVTTKK